MTIEEARKYLTDWGDANEIEDAVARWNNTAENKYDDGNIWVADPQAGHWLSDDKVVEFVEWCESQNAY